MWIEDCRRTIRGGVNNRSQLTQRRISEAQAKLNTLWNLLEEGNLGHQMEADWSALRYYRQHRAQTCESSRDHVEEWTQRKRAHGKLREADPITVYQWIQSTTLHKSCL